MVERYEVCPVEELPPGEKRIVELKDGRLSIGVFNVDGTFHALSNVCPHQLAPLCEGEITGEMVSDSPGEFEWVREGEVIRCPWHGWKFNIADGTSVFNPHEVRTRSFETAVESASDTDAECCERQYGTALEGTEPPVEQFDVEVEDAVVVVYA